MDESTHLCYNCSKRSNSLLSDLSVEELKIRLKKRKTESEEKINMRIAKASIEMATAPQFDFVIENDALKTAFKEAEALVAHHISDTSAETSPKK